MKNHCHPQEVLVSQGVLPVERGLLLADLEQLHRPLLWPKPLKGHCRWRRVLELSEDGRRLAFQVYDIPKTARLEPEAA